MSKEKQIQEDNKKQLIDELSKMPLNVIATAYLHAITSELKPCPFCGTEVKMRKVPLYGYPGCFDFEVKCPKCGCTIDYNYNDTIYRSEKEAVANVVKSWNERKESK